VVPLAGASVSDDGATVVKKLEVRVKGLSLKRDYTPAGSQTKEGQTKIGAFWDAIKARESWRRVYGE
jgi:hypothetical protein